MDPKKKERLEAKGWEVGPAEDFLELTPQEADLVELRLKLAYAVKLLRKDKHLTQAQPAEGQVAQPEWECRARCSRSARFTASESG